MPELEAARSELGPDGGPELLAISLDGPPEGLKELAERYGYRGPIAIADSEEGILGPLGVRNVPGMAFVDRQGIVVGATSRERDREFIVRHARALVR